MARRAAVLATALAALAVACGSRAPGSDDARATSSAESAMPATSIVGWYKWMQGTRVWDAIALLPDGRFYGYREDVVDRGAWSKGADGALILAGRAFAYGFDGRFPATLHIASGGEDELLQLQGASCDEAPDCVGQPTAQNIELCVKGAVIRPDCVRHGCAAHCTPSFLGCARDEDCPRYDRCVPLCAAGGASSCLALGSYCAARP